MALKVSTCMIFRKNQILLMNRNKEPYMGWWAFPGGKVEKGETVRDAVVREIIEETGLRIDPTLYCYLFEELTDNGKNIDLFDLYYHISIINSTQEIITSNEGELKWFNLSDIPNDIVPSDKKILELYLIDNNPINANCELQRNLISTREKKNYEYIIGYWNHSKLDNH